MCIIMLSVEHDQPMGVHGSLNLVGIQFIILSLGSIIPALYHMAALFHDTSLRSLATCYITDAKWC